MFGLRSYKSQDADFIASWIDSEDIFYKWGGDRFGTYPISAEMINKKYLQDNGDCVEPNNFYPMTAFDGDEVVGHFIMRYINRDISVLRFGWVVVDATKRGRGYGRRMLELGLKYAFEIMNVSLVTIGVFENNQQAYKCYKSLGFTESRTAMPSLHRVGGEEWKILELEIARDTYEKKNGR